MAAKEAQSERGRTWDGLVRREVSCSLRVLDEDDRSVEVVASTEALDSHGDIVRQFWDLERYRKNGPVLWNHNIHESSPFSFGGSIRPEDSMPVGKGTEARVEAGQLVAKLVLVKGTPEEEPFVDKLWRRIKQGVVRAVSVGFRPGSITRITNADGTTSHFELGSADRPNELREISFVPMGSNPEAVAKSIAWELENLGRVAAKASADDAERTDTMAMTAEEKKALDDAQAEARVQAERVKSLETELKAEKATTSKLEAELKTASERAAKAEASLVEGEVDKLVGKKITPAERDEHIQLAKDIGIDRVKSILEKRPDITVTDRVKVDGQEVKGNQPAPPPAEGGNGSAAIVDIANKAATAA